MSRGAVFIGLVALAMGAGGCGREPWRAPPPDTMAEDATAGMARVLGQAAEERELDFAEALHPGERGARRRARLAEGTLGAFRDAGEDLFALDAPWNGAAPKPVSPLHVEGGPKTADATRCFGCHHIGGPGGGGTYADVAFFDAAGDDAWSARRRLPPMLAGAALLELAAGSDASRVPFGWAPGRPRRLRDMVRWSAETHLGEAPTDDEIDALTVFIALVPPPRRLPPRRASLTMRAQAGSETFAAIGCAKCHVERLSVSSSTLELSGGRRLDLSSRLGPAPFTVELYSDLAVHHLGDKLAEREGPDRDAFVTPPLWGLASRTAFLHDGRASTPNEAILAHAGEANESRAAYEALAEKRADFDLFLTTLGRSPVMTWIR